MFLGGFHAGGRRPTASETNNNKGAKEMAVEIKHIIKRDGSVKDFDAQKIAYAIECAGKATNQFGRERAEEITETLVMPRLRQLTVATPHIEQVQDAVEHALYEAGYFETLRAYIVYREQRRVGLTSKARLTNTSISPTGALTPTPIRATVWAA